MQGAIIQNMQKEWMTQDLLKNLFVSNAVSVSIVCLCLGLSIYRKVHSFFATPAVLPSTINFPLKSLKHGDVPGSFSTAGGCNALGHFQASQKTLVT